MESNDYQDLLKSVDDWRDSLVRPDKEILSKKKEYKNLIDMEKNLETSTFRIDYKGYQFEGLFNDTEGDYLYVFFMGARGGAVGRRKEIPRFNRWSYHNLVPFSILCIEDPLYFQYEDLPLAWYYGKKAESCLEVLLDLVKVVCRKKGILEKNVVFFGSSGGGTAALYAAYLLKGAMSISINPQIYIQNHPHARYFTQITGIDLHVYDPLYRNDLTECVKRSSSKHLVLYDIRSEEDWQQHMGPFCFKLGISPSYGLTVKDNVAFWLYDCKGMPDPHNSMETRSLFCFIDYVARSFHENKINENIKKVVLFANECWHDYYEMNYALYRIEEENKGNIFGVREVVIFPMKEEYKIGDKITVGIIPSKNENLEYAFYLFKNKFVVEKYGFNKSALLEILLTERGNYRIRGFIKDVDNNRASRFSKTIYVKD